MQQLERYYEVLHSKSREKMRENAIIMSMSMAYASGHLKQTEWNKFLDTICMKKKKVNVNNTIKKMKQQGFNVEER